MANNTIKAEGLIRLTILKGVDMDVEKAKECGNFVKGSSEEPKAEPTSDKLADGIYLIDCKGNAIPYVGRETETVHDTAYVGIVQGDKRVAVALTDMAGGEDITLTCAGDKTDNKIYYIDSYEKTVQDWCGKNDTSHLREIGLNPKIQLKDNEYIPTLAELYLICLNQRKINEALKFVGGKPLAKDWYWSSTEYSATYAWYLSLGDGYANYGDTKASGKRRVRAVSAF